MPNARRRRGGLRESAEKRVLNIVEQPRGAPEVRAILAYAPAPALLIMVLACLAYVGAGGRSIGNVSRSDVLTATLATWGVEATLFALTIAVTSLLLSVSADPAERLSVLSRYRRAAFYPVFAISLSAIIGTGLWAIFLLYLLALRPGVGTYVELVPIVLPLAAELVSLIALVLHAQGLLERTDDDRVAEIGREIRNALHSQLVSAFSWHVPPVVSELAVVSIGIQQARPAPFPMLKAPHRGYVADIHPEQLRRLIDSHPRLQARWGFKAMLTVRLGDYVESRAPLVYTLTTSEPLSEGPIARSMEAIEVRREADPSLVPQRLPALDRLVDRALAAARSGQVGEFRLCLGMLEAAYQRFVELCRDVPMLAEQRLRAYWWAVPIGQREHRVTGAEQLVYESIAPLFLLGADHLLEFSPPIFDAWSAFPGRLIELSRTQFARNTMPLYEIWLRAAERRPQAVLGSIAGYLDRLERFATDPYSQARGTWRSREREVREEELSYFFAALVEPLARGDHDFASQVVEHLERTYSHLGPPDRHESFGYRSRALCAIGWWADAVRSLSEGPPNEHAVQAQLRSLQDQGLDLRAAVELWTDWGERRPSEVVDDHSNVAMLVGLLAIRERTALAEAGDEIARRYEPATVGRLLDLGARFTDRYPSWRESAQKLGADHRWEHLLPAPAGTAWDERMRRLVDDLDRQMSNCFAWIFRPATEDSFELLRLARFAGGPDVLTRLAEEVAEGQLVHLVDRDSFHLRASGAWRDNRIPTDDLAELRLQESLASLLFRPSHLLTRGGLVEHPGLRALGDVDSPHLSELLERHWPTYSRRIDPIVCWIAAAAGRERVEVALAEADILWARPYELSLGSKAAMQNRAVASLAELGQRLRPEVDPTLIRRADNERDEMERIWSGIADFAR